MVGHDEEHYLTKEEEQSLLAVARESMEVFVRRDERLNLDEFELTDTLREPHGAFVTLRRDLELRGCIGFARNEKPLVVAVRDSAVSAASSDPRFRPIDESELHEVWIEVSALTPGDRPETPFRRVRNLDEIVIGRDGLFLERPSNRGGLLLPQVATENGWNHEQFLAALCKKAGAEDGAWNGPGNRLFRFSAQVFSENRAGR